MAECAKVWQFRRFLANQAVDARACYEPFARRIRRAVVGGRVPLLIDALALSGQRQILMVAVACHSRAVPLIWRVRQGKSVTDSEAQKALPRDLIP